MQSRTGSDLRFECLSKNDAVLVDVIHTNGGTKGPMAALGFFGALRPLGHVDFFMNGGSRQPGCYDHPSYPILQRNHLDGCSHWMAVAIYVQSIGKPESFEGKPC